MNNYTDQELNKMGLRVELLKATELPQTICYAAMHQDYSEGNVTDEMFSEFDDGLNFALGCDPQNLVQDPVNPGRCLSEKEAGERLVRLCASRNHYGPLEHPSVILNVIGFPHSFMQQIRTHRIASFDVQSGRYTGKRIEEVGKSLSVEDVFFVRPVGHYADRHGHSLDYSEEVRDWDLEWLSDCSYMYRSATSEGMPYEMARDLYIPYSIRQNFVMSTNLRAFLHILEMRGTKDAELEAQWFCQLTISVLKKWAPEVIGWWLEKRFGKNKIAP